MSSLGTDDAPELGEDGEVRRGHALETAQDDERVHPTAKAKASDGVDAECEKKATVGEAAGADDSLNEAHGDSEMRRALGAMGTEGSGSSFEVWVRARRSRGLSAEGWRA